jgi:hypothetical protein
LDDENAHQKAGGRNGQQQRDGVADVEAEDHECPAPDEGQDRGRQLGEAAAEAWCLVRARRSACPPLPMETSLRGSIFMPAAP